MRIKLDSNSNIINLKHSLVKLFSDIRCHYYTLGKYWQLIRFMVSGEFKSDLFKTFLGDAWLLIDPLTRMTVYYFLLIVLFRSGDSYGVNPFLLIMLGITHYNFFQQSITSASLSILNNESILMQLHIEALVFVAVSFFQTLRNFFFSLCLYIIVYLFIHPPANNIIFYPFVLLVIGIWSWSLGIISASLTVFFRDCRQISSILLYVGMYFAPVIYVSSFFPQKYVEVFLYNPIACLFALLQWSMFNTTLPIYRNIIFMLLSTGIVLVFSHFIYRNLRFKFTKAF